MENENKPQPVDQDFEPANAPSRPFSEDPSVTPTAENPMMPEPEKRLTPEEQAAIEEEMDKRRALMDYLKTDVLNRLEEEHAESQLGALMRSKNFWYGVFGLIFILWMGALILWVAHDLAK